VDHNKWRLWVKEALELALRNRWDQYTTRDKDDQVDVDWDGLKAYLERELQGLLRRELQTRASLLFLMQYPQSIESMASRVSQSNQSRRQRSTARVAS
jgi:ribonuclease J